MKNRFAYPLRVLYILMTFIALLIVPALLCCCNTAQKIKWSIELSCFPEDSSSYTMKIVEFSENSEKHDLCGEIDLGKVTPVSVLRQTIDIEPSAVEVGFYLLDSTGDPSYFYSVLVSDVTDGTVTLQYWLDYDEFFDLKQVKFGLNRAYVRTMPEDGIIELDYSDAPLYIYGMTGVKDKDLEITASNKLGSSSVSFGSSFDDFMKSSWLYVGTKHGDTWFHKAALDNFLILVKPNDYKTDSICMLSANRFESLLIYNAFQADDAFMYFDACPSGGYGFYRVLKKWDVSKGTAIVVSSFTEGITESAQDGGILYLGVGAKLYTFDTATGIFTHVQNFPGMVAAICPAGDNLVVYYTESSYSSFSKPVLVSKTDFSLSTPGTSTDTPSSSVFFPDQNRIYYLRSGSTSGDICYQPFDPVTKTLGKAGSTYFSGYTFQNPLKRLGDEAKVITGSGHIFDVSDTTTNKSKFSEAFGSKFSDCIVLQDCIITLQNAADGFYIVKSARTSPYSETGRSQKYTSEQGTALFRTASGLSVVSRSMYGNGVRLRNVPLSDLTARDIGAARTAAGTNQYGKLPDRRMPAYR